MRSLHGKLSAWYKTHARDLPWRRTSDPYRIWLSEIMLQQTRVETVLPYYEKFLRRYPTVQELAAADIDELRSLWAGLGYYSRALNLHRAAQKIVRDFSGRIPRALMDLRSLPGIGPYTAAAIASIAFGDSVAAVDGNLERVIARLLALEKIAKNSAEVAKFASELTALGNAGAINQALMDLSSMVCGLKNPKCLVCPLHDECGARAQNLTDRIPQKAPKKAKVELEARALLVFHATKTNGPLEILVARRPEGAWLSGMWDLPWTILDRDLPPRLPKIRVLGTAKVNRTITHHKVKFSVDYAIAAAKPSGPLVRKSLRAAGAEFRWLPMQEIASLPNPSRRAISAAIKSLQLGKTITPENT